MQPKTLKKITQTLLLAVIAVTPFYKVSSLYFPFVSGRVYLFRLLVVLAFFFWIWHLTKVTSYKLQVTRSILVVALILFFLAQILVSFFGVDPLFSFFSSISRSDGVFQYGFWILYLLMLIFVFKEDKDWKILFSVFTVVAFIMSLFAWLGFPPEQEIYGNLFGNPAYFSGFLIFAIGFSLLTFERKFFSNPLLNNLFLVLSVFFAVTLVFTKIRGAFIGLAGGIFLFCALSAVFLRRERENRKLALFCGIALLAGVVSLLLLFSARETEFVKNNVYLSRVASIAEFRAADSPIERFLVWNVALKAFLEKPLLGWGPENFASAFNKYYDLRVGERETWFDRAHNVPLDILATGGVFLFAFYLFWIFAVLFLILKIASKVKILSFILGSVFFAYFLQGLFFFDTFANSLGLFPFLAYLVYLNPKSETLNPKQIQNSKFKIQNFILVVAAVFSAFLIYATVIMPWKANAAALNFYTHTEAELYKESKPFLKKAFVIKSPYTYWEVRRELAWQFLRILEDRVKEGMPSEDLQAIKETYDLITPELERFIIAKPQEPQMYYVLGRIYLAGFEKLHRDDLGKAETILKKALNYSDLRQEYFQELKRALVLQGKFDEAEILLQGYVQRVDFYDYYPFLTMGHFYFDVERYQQAQEQYEKAREVGYDFCRVGAEYSRYMFSAEQAGNYQKVVEMGQECLQKRGPDAATYFNVAVGFFHLGEKEKAREFFLKAFELDPKEYEQYREIFAPTP
ncbi:MAG: glycosyl transferase family protein [Parcubacteria group bacterium Gr01-1014_30]|nr:MAG: glycosyl transferase family protein [Parcubacteria group bacterium Gr01-1014_30]